jgi:hypothetical protein
MTDIQNDTEALNTKYLEIERSYQMARLHSNRASIPTSDYLNNEEKVFVACFQFGRHVTSVMLTCLEDCLTNKLAKTLCDQTSATHDDICNNVVRTFVFTDADSTTCPCQIDVDDLDVYSCILDDLRKGHGQEGNNIQKLHDALNPVADALLAIAVLEKDDAALDTAKRIKTLLLA